MRQPAQPLRSTTAPLVVEADRRKAARGAIASCVIAAICLLAAARGEPLVGVSGALLFGYCAFKLARTSRSPEPVLVADAVGVRLPRAGLSAAWNEVDGVGYAVNTFNGTTTHVLRISVRDPQAVLRRRSGDVRLRRSDRGMLVRHNRIDLQLDDLRTSPAEIAAEVEERFRSAGAADSLEEVDSQERLVRRRGSAAVAPNDRTSVADAFRRRRESPR